MANETKATKVTEFTIKIDENKLITTDIKSFYPPHASMLNRATRLALREIKVMDRQRSSTGYYEKKAAEERKLNEAKKKAEEEKAKEKEEEAKTLKSDVPSDPNVPQASNSATKEEPKTKET